MFDIKEFDIEKFDAILSRGLSHGLGMKGSQVCIEAAICETLGLAHGDDPKCVAISVRRFKIRLNDSRWSSPTARATGLRDLGIAQLGSIGVVKDTEFVKLMAEKTIRRLIPMLFRGLWPDKVEAMAVADRCEKEGSRESALEAKKYAAYAADAAADAADAYAAAAAAAAAAYAADADAAAAAAYAAGAAAAAYAAAYAADAAADAADAAVNPQIRDKYLILSANLALETLRELNSPGVSLLT